MNPESISHTTEESSVHVTLEVLAGQLSSFLEEKMNVKDLEAFTQNLEVENDVTRRLKDFCSRDKNIQKKLAFLKEVASSGEGDVTRNAQALHIISLLMPETDTLFRKVFGTGPTLVDRDEELKKSIFGEDRQVDDPLKRDSTPSSQGEEYTNKMENSPQDIEQKQESPAGATQEAKNIPPQDIEIFRTAITWVSDFLIQAEKYDGVDELYSHLKSDKNFSVVRHFCTADQAVRARLEDMQTRLQAKPEKKPRDEKVFEIVKMLLVAAEENPPETLIPTEELLTLQTVHDSAVRSRYSRIIDETPGLVTVTTEKVTEQAFPLFIKELREVVDEQDDAALVDGLRKVLSNSEGLFQVQVFETIDVETKDALLKTFVDLRLRLSRCENKALARLNEKKIEDIDALYFSGEVGRIYRSALSTQSYRQDTASIDAQDDFLDTQPGDLPSEDSVLLHLDVVPSSQELMGLCLQFGCSPNLLQKVKDFFDQDKERQSAILQLIYLLSNNQVLDGYVTRNENAFFQEKTLEGVSFLDGEFGAFLKEKRELALNIDRGQLDEDQKLRLARLVRVINNFVPEPQREYAKEGDSSIPLAQIDEKDAFFEIVDIYHIDQEKINNLSKRGRSALSKIALLCNERYQSTVLFNKESTEVLSMQDYDLINSAMGESSFAELFVDTGFISLVRGASTSFRRLNDANQIAEPALLASVREKCEPVKRVFNALLLNIEQRERVPLFEEERLRLEKDIDSILDKIDSRQLQEQDGARLSEILVAYHYTPSESVYAKIKELHEKIVQSLSTMIDISFMLSGDTSLPEEQIIQKTLLNSLRLQIESDGLLTSQREGNEEKERVIGKPQDSPVRLKGWFANLKNRLVGTHSRSEKTAVKMESVRAREGLAKKGAMRVYEKYKNLPFATRLAITTVLTGAGIGASFISAPSAVGVMTGVFVGKTVLRGFSAIAASELTSSVLRPRLEKRYLEKHKDALDLKGYETDQKQAIARAEAEKTAKRFGVAAGLALFLVGEVFDVVKLADMYNPVPSVVSENISTQAQVFAPGVESITETVSQDVIKEVVAGQTLEGILKQPEVLEKLVGESGGALLQSSFAQENYVQNILAALKSDPSLLKVIGLEHSRSVGEIYPGDKLNVTKLIEIADKLRISVAGRDMTVVGRALQMINRLH